MKVAKRLGLGLAAVCAFSALAVSGASASPTFLAHPPGGLLLATAGGSQVLNTKGGTIVCTALKLLPPGDKAPATLQSLSITVIVNYEKCKAFGLAATIAPVTYLIDANGLVILENTVVVKALECEVTIPSAKNQSLNTVKFENTAANRGILLLVNVTKVTSFGTGVACTYAEESVGTAEGTIHVTMHGGVIRWDP